MYWLGCWSWLCRCTGLGAVVSIGRGAGAGSGCLAAAEQASFESCNKVVLRGSVEVER